VHAHSSLPSLSPTSLAGSSRLVLHFYHLHSLLMDFRSLSRRIHPASRVPIASHNPHLLRLMEAEISNEMVRYVAGQVIHVINVDGDSPNSSLTSRRANPSVSTDVPLSTCTDMESLECFIWQLIRACNVQMGTLLTTIIYLERLKAKLRPRAKGMVSALSACQPQS
jgi:PHO85 cyclin-1